MGRTVTLPKHHIIPIKDETQTNFIMIEEGPYVGVAFRFGQVSFDETPEGLKCNYVYEVRDPGEHTHTGLENDAVFREVLNAFMDDALIHYNTFLTAKKESSE